jgi:hypothetical protein
VAKPRTILIISAILVIIGIGISFYQSEREMESITTQQQSLDPGSTMTVTKNLDPAKSKNGVYSVQISDFKDGDKVRANIIDQTGNTISTSMISKSQFQDNFTIFQLENYTLQIQNTGQNETQILGIIGYYPQGATILDVASVIVLTIGLIGLGVGMVKLIKKRGKTDVS